MLLGLTSCSGHGLCSGNPTYACSCSSGWTGADCSERTCPSNVNWFTLPSADNVAHLTELVECGGMGICDRTTGICTCSTGFTGAACERFSCPGSVMDCNGNGKCYTMQKLATLATVNGDNAGFTYGAIPNNPLTWDAEKVYGCYCDDGWHGYDCSLMDCPHGDDPLTVSQLDEVQILKCTDSDVVGTLLFSFRDELALYPVNAAATVYETQQALSTIVGIGAVTVSILNDGDTDALCTTTGTEILVTFHTSYGDVPLLQFSNTDVDAFLVEEYVVGTKENLECSGRGLCVTTTGICSCFSGFGSSDGFGGIGTTGDCSYVNPVPVTSA